MTTWHAPQKPSDYTEEALVTSILEGTFAIGTTLPAERSLAEQLGVTRPTLREALRRLERDGWLTVHQGKPTVVNDFWREGGMNVVATLVRFTTQLPPDFVRHMLEIRADLAPSYMSGAVCRQPALALDLLAQVPEATAVPEVFARFDWMLHHTLATAADNPIYTLILNGFADFYQQVAEVYFGLDETRPSSVVFYGQLRKYAETAAKQQGATALEGQIRALVTQSMRRSLTYWGQGAAAGV